MLCPDWPPKLWAWSERDWAGVVDEPKVRLVVEMVESGRWVEEAARELMEDAVECWLDRTGEGEK